MVRLVGSFAIEVHVLPVSLHDNKIFMRDVEIVYFLRLTCGPAQLILQTSQ